MFWFTIVLVVILGFCLAPKVVRSTPPSPGAVELYKREHASGVVVSGLEITFPSDYGFDIYSDGSRVEKELYNVRARILQGPGKTVLKTLRPQRPNQLPPGNSYLEYITGGTLEECSKRCRELPECAAFYRKENGECILHRMGASGTSASWYTQTSYVKRRIARATPIGTIVPV